MSSLSTHVLDTTKGAPAAEIRVTLCALKDGGADGSADGSAAPRSCTTDGNGRIAELLSAASPGRYRLTYELGAYLFATDRRGLYPLIELEVELVPERHHHVVVTLSPYGYFVACVPS
jgi:5-hydroxyisourate hydrolase